MSLRAKASAMAVIAAAGLLLAPIAMASGASRGTVQVTGKQLKSALTLKLIARVSALR